LLNQNYGDGFLNCDVIAYHLNNRAEVQAYLRQQQEGAQKIWEQIEAKADYRAFRERLLVRYQAKTSPANQ
jgi:hypothetical protein